jgi:hypothetical protein
MNICEELERKHSKSVTDSVISFIGNDPQRFRKLLNIFLSDNKVMSQRASWPLSHLALKNPNLIKPHFAKLFKKIESPGNHDAVARHLLRIFQEIDVPAKYESRLLDLCYNYIRGEEFAVAIRALSITTAARICKKYPGLENELLLLLRELILLHQPPAINVRIKLALKELGRR